MSLLFREKCLYKHTLPFEARQGSGDYGIEGKRTCSYQPGRLSGYNMSAVKSDFDLCYLSQNQSGSESVAGESRSEFIDSKKWYLQEQLGGHVRHGEWGSERRKYVPATDQHAE